MSKVFDLGWCIGRIDTDVNHLVIVQPQFEDEHSFTPASCVQICKESGLKALRDALLEAYPLDHKEG